GRQRLCAAVDGAAQPQLDPARDRLEVLAVPGVHPVAVLVLELEGERGDAGIAHDDLGLREWIAVGQRALAHDQARLLARLERDDHRRKRDRRLQGQRRRLRDELELLLGAVEEHHELGRLALRAAIGVGGPQLTRTSTSHWRHLRGRPSTSRSGVTTCLTSRSHVNAPSVPLSRPACVGDVISRALRSAISIASWCSPESLSSRSPDAKPWIDTTIAILRMASAISTSSSVKPDRPHTRRVVTTWPGRRGPP